MASRYVSEGGRSYSGPAKGLGPEFEFFDWCRSSASQCDQISTKLEAPELTRHKLNQNFEETEFENEKIGVDLPLAVSATDTK